MKAKARLVAKGYTQLESIDYLETFIPTLATASIRMLTAFACEHDLDMYYHDAEHAFARSELDDELSMRLPPDVKMNPEMWCLLTGPCMD